MDFFRRLFGRKPTPKASGPQPRPQPTITKAQLAKFPYPLEIVHGSQALQTFERLKSAGRGSPVILGGAEDISQIIEQIDFSKKDGGSTEKSLRLAASMTFPRDLRAERERVLNDFLKRHPDFVPETEDVEVGDWPPVAPVPAALTVPYEIVSGQPFEQTYIGLIPTNDPTEIPAFLHAGGWNENPDAAHHVAALRSWRDRYGAELVAMSFDVINLRVERRPKDRAEALVLAREQFDYCEDIVLQGTDTLSALGASLMETDWWYFWWD